MGHPWNHGKGPTEWKLGWDLLTVNRQMKSFHYSRKRCLLSQASESEAVITSSSWIMYKKSWSTYLCNVVCWIPTSIVTSEHFKLSTILRSVTFWLLTCPLNGGETQFLGPRIQVTNTEIMWTFFRDQVLCLLNWGVTWIEVSQRKYSTIFFQKWYIKSTGSDLWEEPPRT